MANTMKLKLLLILVILTLSSFFIYMKSDYQFIQNFSEVKSPIFKEFRHVIKRNCASCHDYYMRMTEKDWVTSNLVTPSSLTHSRIYSSIRGTSVGGDEDMPPKVSISKNEIEIVKTWIHSLAKYSSTLKDEKDIHPPVTFSKSNKLSAIEVFERCYIQITGERPSKDDVLYKGVSDNSMTPSSACLGAMNESSFSVTKREYITPLTAQKIRDNFHRFFTSWFSNYSYYRAGASYLSHDIYPMDGAALQMTYTMWNDKHYKDVLLEKGTLEAIRESNQKNDTHLFFESPSELQQYEVYEYGDTKSQGNSKSWSPKWLPRGKLINITKKESFETTPWYVNRDMNVLLFKKPLTLDRDFIGANTTQSYILNNLGRDPGERSTGGLVIPRTWSRKVITDFLFRELPVIRIEDTSNYIQKDSKIKFRSKSSCMQCHTTIDPMAGALRNIQSVYTSSSGDTSIHTRYFKVTKKVSKNLLPDIDRDFHLRPPTGRFIYRTTRGLLIDKEFKNIFELNNLLVNTDDYYQCATKKLLYYMTGIEINLSDNMFTQDSDKRSQYIRELVSKISNDFKTTGNLKLLIRDIIKSDIYHQEDFGGL